jgi:hypothetical protein
MFKRNYEGIDIEIDLSSHAIKRINQREMVKSAIYASVMAAMDFILEYKNGTEFIVVDKDCESSTVASVRAEGGVICIDVITVVDNTNVFVKKGTKIIRLGNVTIHDNEKE